MCRLWRKYGFLLYLYSSLFHIGISVLLFFWELIVRLTIFTKLFISLFSLSLCLIIGMSLLINHSFKTGFQSYLNHLEKEKITRLSEELGSFYDEGWKDTIQNPRTWNDLLQRIGEVPLPPMNARPRVHYQRGDSVLIPLGNRITLFDNQQNIVWGKPLESIDSHTEIATVPIVKNDQNIGWLKVRQKNIIDGPLVESFYQQQRHNFYWIISLASLVSLLITALLVRHFLKPLKALHQGAKLLSDGFYDEAIYVNGKDELAELSHAFNSLASNLKRQKKTREQWITDISHELRTPIAVLRSEIEAIQDGIRQPEMKYIHSMHGQVLNLSKLVDDLYLLSRSDSGILDISLKRLNIISTIDQIIDGFDYRLEEKGIVIQKNYNIEDPVYMKGDQPTLQQLMTNLLENSLRYTDAPGEIRISVIDNIGYEGQVKLIVEDSAPTVNEEQLPRLFDRLYRVDQSRSRALGGSGLGLSICQNIVQQHQGEIYAYQSDLGGIKIEVLLKK